MLLSTISVDSRGADFDRLSCFSSRARYKLCAVFGVFIGDCVASFTERLLAPSSLPDPIADLTGVETREPAMSMCCMELNRGLEGDSADDEVDGKADKDASPQEVEEVGVDIGWSKEGAENCFAGV